MPAIGAKTTGMAMSCLPYFRPKLTVDSFEDVVANLRQRDSLLRHSVALANGYRLIVWSVKVDSDAERSSDLVLTTVTTPNCTRVIELYVPDCSQLIS